MKKLSLVASVACALVLGAGITVSISAAMSNKGVTINDGLLTTLPNSFSGYEVKNLPIATSQEMQRAVDEMLNYDDCVYREYVGGGQDFTVYAAYWTPRKFHPRLIAIHTPDVCWVVNGWKLVLADYNYEAHQSGTRLWPAQYRVFTANDLPTYVLYWHIVDGRLSGYASGPSSHSNSFFSSVWKDLASGVGEQFFIRISSSRPVKDWEKSALYAEIINAFSPVLKQSP